MADAEPERMSTSTHWGAYWVEREGGAPVRIVPFERDEDPSVISASMMDTLTSMARIRRPSFRRSWLEGGPGTAGERRGADSFVELPWDEALDVLAGELKRVRETYGNEAIYAGSYGWASAGRFHHAQSQIHRFFNMFGGYVKSVNAYSYAAAEVILPHVITDLRRATVEAPSYSAIANHGDFVVAFGGLSVKNAQINAGGVAVHTARDWLRRAAENGVEFVSVGPLRDDTPTEARAQWLPVRPNSDTALMLALAHVLETEDLADRAFLDRYTVGYDGFRPYLLGDSDGVPKTPEWAAPLCGVPSDTIHALARKMAARRALVAVSWSLQRSDHGEQPYWMAVVLSAMLGRIGELGAGLAIGIGSEHGNGNPDPQYSWAALPRGENPVKRFIPVARIADMLLNPGGAFQYNGQDLIYPDVRLVYWAGGNPFHHHQDLNRLRKAWAKPETVVVQDPFWTACARHADIALPATSALERSDIGATSLDGWAVAMKQAAEPVGEARNDFDILAGLARRLGFEERFTEGREEMAWLRHFWDISRQRAGKLGRSLPSFEEFWDAGILRLEGEAEDRAYLADFRADPEANPLPTPSGRIEIFSETIAGFGYEDVPGHPVWHEPSEWLGRSDLTSRFPLHLMSNQPKIRLHSQLDPGKGSTDSKIQGREPARLNPSDAAARGIVDGDVIRLFNDRGACLAGAVLDDAVMPGVVQLATGAWYDPLDPGQEKSLDRHGNPNVLTRDQGTSRLAQGTSAHTTLVEVERLVETPPETDAFSPPALTGR